MFNNIFHIKIYICLNMLVYNVSIHNVHMKWGCFQRAGNDLIFKTQLS